MLKTIALLFLTSTAWAGGGSLTPPSPNGNAITPASVTLTGGNGTISTVSSSITANGFFGGTGSFGSGSTKSAFTAAGFLILDAAAAFRPGIRTKAQFDAITPVAGDIYVCSDCTVPYDVCVATGATLSGFRAVVNSAINTAIPGTLVNKGCGSGN